MMFKINSELLFPPAFRKSSPSSTQVAPPEWNPPRQPQRSSSETPFIWRPARGISGVGTHRDQQGGAQGEKLSAWRWRVQSLAPGNTLLTSSLEGRGEPAPGPPQPLPLGVSPVPLWLHLPPQVLSSLATVFGFWEENVEQARLHHSGVWTLIYDLEDLCSFSFFFFSCVSVLRNWSCSHRHLTLNPPVIVLIVVSKHIRLAK